jgi:hypothetical protein
MSRAPIAMTVKGGRFSAMDAYAAEQLSQLPDGDYSVRVSRLTNSGREERAGMRGLWFAGLQLLSENTEDPEYDSPKKAYDQIRIDLGYVRRRYRIDKSWEYVPISTAEETFSDEEMAILQERARAFCVERFGFDPWAQWTEQQDAAQGTGK